MGKINYRDLPDERFREIGKHQYYYLEAFTKQPFVVLKRDDKLYLTFDKNVISYFNSLHCHKCNKCRHFYYDECNRIASGIVPLDYVKLGYVCRTNSLTFHGVIQCGSFVFMHNINIPKDRCDHTGGIIRGDLDDDDDNFDDEDDEFEAEDRIEDTPKGMPRDGTNTGATINEILRFLKERDRH